jgi:fermentation-respiration switch protein FrsA (DUF1100 family)
MTPLGWVAAAFLALALAISTVFLWLASGKMIARRTPDERTSPADYGLSFEEIEFQARDGINLRGWFIPAPEAKGVVIFCHGHAGSMDPDVKYTPWFYDAGLSVLMFDFRGHGRSEGDWVSMGTLERLDLLGAIDYVQRSGFESVGVLGFSMGGGVAIVTAATDERIAAVASDGGFARLESALIGWANRIGGVPEWVGRPLARTIKTVAGWRLGISLSEADPIDWIGRIRPRPVLLVHGDQDPYVSVAEVEEMFAEAGEPKDLWRVEEAEHRRADQCRPQEYRQWVVGFFERYLT